MTTRMPVASAAAWRWALMVGFVVAVGLLAAVNLYLAGRSFALVASGAPAVDWRQFVEASERVFSGDLYDVTDTYSWPYSPLLAYIAGPLAWIGESGWRLLHFAGALAMPSWPMRLLTLVSWPFWFDVETGNLLVFVVLAAAWALRGGRVAGVAYLLGTLLVPRPLMLPVLAWLLWKRPAWRVPFLALAVAYVLAVAATGWGDDWIRFLLDIGTQFGSPNNLGPTRFVGAIWLVVGIPLAIFLLRRGHVGWASVSLSYPYLLPYYLLVLVLEFGGSAPRTDSARAVS